jgi:hypothetical protein
LETAKQDVTRFKLNCNDLMIFKMYKGLLIFIFLFALTAQNAGSAEVSLDAAYSGRYIWRGMPINEDPVIQPSLNISGSGFSLNVWGNIDTTDWGENEGGYGEESGNITEIDYTAFYEHSIGPVSLSAGFISYTFPNIGLDSTLEVFAGLGLDVPLSPAIKSCWDEDMAWGANYLSLDVGHSFSLWQSGERALGLDLFAATAYANREFNEAYYGIENEGWHDWSAGLSLPLSLKFGISITPGYFHSSILSDDIKKVIEDSWDRKTENDVLSLSMGWSSVF